MKWIWNRKKTPVGKDKKHWHLHAQKLPLSLSSVWNCFQDRQRILLTPQSPRLNSDLPAACPSCGLPETSLLSSLLATIHHCSLLATSLHSRLLASSLLTSDLIPSLCLGPLTQSAPKPASSKTNCQPVLRSTSNRTARHLPALIPEPHSAAQHHRTPGGHPCWHPACLPRLHWSSVIGPVLSTLDTSPSTSMVQTSPATVGLFRLHLGPSPAAALPPWQWQPWQPGKPILFTRLCFLYPLVVKN